MFPSAKRVPKVEEPRWERLSEDLTCCVHLVLGRIGDSVDANDTGDAHAGGLCQCGLGFGGDIRED